MSLNCLPRRLPLHNVMWTPVLFYQQPLIFGPPQRAHQGWQIKQILKNNRKENIWLCPSNAYWFLRSSQAWKQDSLLASWHWIPVNWKNNLLIRLGYPAGLEPACLPCRWSAPDMEPCWEGAVCTWSRGWCQEGPHVSQEDTEAVYHFHTNSLGGLVFLLLKAPRIPGGFFFYF